MIPIDPFTITVGALAFLALKKQNGPDFGAFTEEREDVYRNALEYLKEPERLRELAEQFQKSGLKVQAAVLNRRAAWRSRTDAQKEVHDQIYAQALASQNVPAILKVAAEFEKLTATQRAKTLRERAAQLKEERLKLANTPVPAAPASTPESQIPTEPQATVETTAIALGDD